MVNDEHRELPPPAGQSFTTQGRAVIRTQSVLDGNGRLKQLIDDRGAATNYAYDTLNRQITMTFVDGSVRISGYNAASDVITYTDENGSVFTSTFDPLGRRTAVSITLATNVVGTTAQSFEYDGLSRLTSSTDSIGADDAVALFFYDSLGRVVEEAQTFDGNTRYVTHDAFTSYPATDTTLPNDRQIAMRYDLLYRKDLVNETDGAVLIAKWRFIGPGRTLELELGNGLVCTQLNNDRTHSAVQPSVSNPTWGDQSSDRLGYDGAGRMITKRYLSDEVNDGTGVYANPASLVGFTTSFDPASNKTYERHLHAENRSHLYPNYDSADRLLEYQRGTPASGGASVSTPITLPGTNTLQNYDLDGLGNWKKTQFSPAGGSLTTQQRRHNYLNQITKFGATNVLYDHGNNAASDDPLIAQRGNGNLTDDGTLTLTYDALNRLKQAFRKSDNNQIAEYIYDALGRRIRKIVTHGGITGNSDLNGTTDFLLDGVQVVEERNVNDDEIKQYVWGHYVDELIQIKAYRDIGSEPLTAGNYYLLSDLLYRSVALTNDSGTIVEAYDTDAYGNTICFKAAGTGGNWFAADAVTTDNPANTTIFTGREFDPETRLYYYRARYYEPQLGRFMARDFLWKGYFSLFDNLYKFVLNSPSRFLDPLGLDPSVTLCIAYGKSVNLKPDSDLMKKYVKGHLDALNKAIAYCRNSKDIKIDIPDAKIISNDLKDRIDDTKIKEIKITDIKVIQALVKQIPRGDNKNCIPVLFTETPLIGEKGANGFAIEGVAIVMTPLPGIPENYNTLPHECGHYAGYNCGDAPPEQGGLHHNKSNKNIMYPDESDEVQNPDECWCKKMLALSKK